VQYCDTIYPVEIGPHSALQAPIHDTITELKGMSDIKYTSLLLRNNPADVTMLDAIGQIRNSGYAVNVERVNNLSSKPGKYIALPNLPEYVFDHSKQYWEETRLSNRYRLSPQGKIDLLGKPILDWNPLEPRWRNFLRVSEMPWIEDHVINGALIYPGAGMLVTAIEAAHQISAGQKDVVGFELKDVSFVRSLNIPRDSEGVETHFSIRLAQEDTKPLSMWSQWRLFAYEQHDWHECCRGLVRTRYARASNKIDMISSAKDDLARKREIHQNFIHSCQTMLDTQLYYDNLPKNGYNLGPSFQRLLGGSYNTKNEVQATVELFRWPVEHYPQSHIVHPTTLDCLFQVGLLGYMDGGRKGIPTMVRDIRTPKKLESISSSYIKVVLSVHRPSKLCVTRPPPWPHPESLFVLGFSQRGLLRPIL
jgi:acyl transferase domain-containing protein